MVTGIKVGTEIVPSDDPITDALNGKHPLGGNLVLFPLRNRVRRNPEPLREFLLRSEMLENSGERVVHMKSVLHYGLRKRNRQLIDAYKPPVDNENMADTPRPEHFGAFNEWLEAVRLSRRLTKASIAQVAGKTPQAASKWFAGGDIEPGPLRKIADWAGVPYAELRLLLDGQPITTHKRRNGSISVHAPTVQRISRKIEQLAGDETSISAVEAVIDTLLASHVRPRKRTPRE